MCTCACTGACACTCACTCPRRDAMDGRSARRRRKNLPGSSFAFCPLFCFRRTFLVLLLLFLPSPFRFAFLFSFALAPSSSSSSPPSLLRPVPFLPSSFPPFFSFFPSSPILSLCLPFLLFFLIFSLPCPFVASLLSRSRRLVYILGPTGQGTTEVRRRRCKMPAAGENGVRVSPPS